MLEGAGASSDRGPGQRWGAQDHLDLAKRRLETDRTRAMNEILPGVFHWVTFHAGIEENVHSYYVEASTPAVLIDPRVPDEGLAWFQGHAPPAHIYLTNRHHYRHSGHFAEGFGSTVWCHTAGLHEFTKDEQVRGFEHGDALPGAVRALEVGVLCPEETALQFDLSGGILAIGDAIVRDGRGRLGFVPDALMGEDPEGVKRGLREVFRRHLRHDFDHLLFAHGKPLVGAAKETLRSFVESRER
jgi:hypothetical protein